MVMINAEDYTWEECINLVHLSSCYGAVERAAEAWGKALTSIDSLADGVEALLRLVSTPKAWEGKTAEAVRALLARLVAALRETVAENRRMPHELGEVAVVARDAWNAIRVPDQAFGKVESLALRFSREGFAPKLDRYEFWPARRDMAWYDHVRYGLLPIEAIVNGNRLLGRVSAAIPGLAGLTSLAFFRVEGEAQSALKRMCQGYEHHAKGFSEFTGAKVPNLGGDAAEDRDAVVAPPVPPPMLPRLADSASDQPGPAAAPATANLDGWKGPDVPGPADDGSGLADYDPPDWDPPGWEPAGSPPGGLAGLDGGSGAGVGAGPGGAPMAGGGAGAANARLAGAAGAGGTGGRGMPGMMYPPLMGGLGAPAGGDARPAGAREKLADDSGAFDLPGAAYGVIGP